MHAYGGRGGAPGVADDVEVHAADVVAVPGVHQLGLLVRHRAAGVEDDHHVDDAGVFQLEVLLHGLVEDAGLVVEVRGDDVAHLWPLAGLVHVELHVNVAGHEGRAEEGDESLEGHPARDKGVGAGDEKVEEAERGHGHGGVDHRREDDHRAQRVERRQPRLDGRPRHCGTPCGLRNGGLHACHPSHHGAPWL